MSIIGAIFFVLAILCYIIDKIVDSADMSLKTITCIFVIVAGVCVALHYILMTEGI